MNKKKNKGKAIYNPTGKAGEYSDWACGFYVGCSNGCSYCYCKKGLLAKAMGQDMPILKKGFRSIGHAKDVFEREMLKNRSELQKHGLFLTFTSDPFLPETIELTVFALTLCLAAGIPVQTLTKRADFTQGIISFMETEFFWHDNYKERFAFGFTLTGCDQLEPGASTNEERIEAMRILHYAGFKTWASIEPIIDINESLYMIQRTLDFCDFYKIGLLSGKKYNPESLKHFAQSVINFTHLNGYKGSIDGIPVKGNVPKIYFKDSFIKQSGLDRANLPENCVSRDYNMFTTINPTI